VASDHEDVTLVADRAGMKGSVNGRPFEFRIVADGPENAWFLNRTRGQRRGGMPKLSTTSTTKGTDANASRIFVAAARRVAASGP